VIYLLTGAPGAGKTLKMLHDWLASADGSRPIYVFGVEGLVPSDKWLPLDDPKAWHKLPFGSIVLIDEAQHVFRPRRPGDPVPEYVAAAETHRHLGIDLVMTTQFPMQLDAHLRRLCSSHEHLVNVWGLKGRSAVFAWDEVQDDPKDRGARKLARRSIFKYPKDVYALYKSSQIHTKKTRIPVWFKFGLPALLILLLGIGVFLVHFFSSLGDSHQVRAARSSASASADSPVVAPASSPAPVRSDLYRHPLSHFNKVSRVYRNRQLPSLVHVSDRFRVAGFVQVGKTRRYLLVGPSGSMHTVSASACSVLDGLRVCRWGGAYVVDRPASSSSASPSTLAGGSVPAVLPSSLRSPGGFLDSAVGSTASAAGVSSQLPRVSVSSVLP